MSKPIAAIELGSKKLKLVIGHEIDGKVYVVYSLVKPYGHIIEAGKVIESGKLTAAIREIKEIADPSQRLKINISEALVALPPYGLEVFQTQHVTTVISEEGKIREIDIRNIYALIKNGSLPLDNQLIDIAPEKYVLDHGRTFVRPPIDESSPTLTVTAKVHTLPKRILGEYKNAMISGGIYSRRFCIAPFAASELLATYDDVPPSYLLVDIGSNITTVSLIGEKQLYASCFFEWGGDNITEKIIETFNINENEAEDIKIKYGIDKREMNFKAPVCMSDDGNGQQIKHYVSDLNAVIKGELEIFVRQLNDSITHLLEKYDSSLKSLPMVLVGGGAKLNGLVDYVLPKVQSDSVMVVTPRTLGARNPTFTNCLGMILANTKYPNVYDETQPRVGTVSRENDTK